MPSTEGLGTKLKEAGAQGRRSFEEGFTGGGSLSKIGQDFANQITQGFRSGMSRLELPAGLSTGIDGLVRGFDGLKSRSEAVQAAHNKLIDTDEKLALQHERVAVAQARVNDLEAKGAQTSSQYLSAKTSLHGALQREESLTRQSTEAHTGYQSALEGSKGGMMAFAMETGLVAGVVGGAIPLVGQLVTGMAELGGEAVKKSVEVLGELASKLVEVGEDYDHLSIQLTEFSGATGETFAALDEHAKSVFATLDAAGKDFGQTYSQLASVLKLEAGPALDNLSRQVAELTGRFPGLKATDITQIFTAFKVPADDLAGSLATLVSVGQQSGLGLKSIVDALGGGAAEVLQTAGLSLGQSAQAVADMEKHGVPANAMMTALQKTMALFSKQGWDFPTGLRELFTFLTDPTKTNAQKDALAQQAFGVRKWGDALALIPDLLRDINAGADAFNAPAAKTDEFLQKTQDLDNKIQEFKHHLEAMFAPFGEAFLGGLEHSLDNVKKWFDQHHTEIIGKIRGWGDAFIDLLPKIQEFAVIALRLLEPLAVGLTVLFAPLASAMVAAGAGFLALTGHFKDAKDLLAAGVKFPFTEADMIRAFDHALDKIDAIKIDTDAIKHGWDGIADKAAGIALPGTPGGAPLPGQAPVYGPPSTGGPAFGWPHGPSASPGSPPSPVTPPGGPGSPFMQSLTSPGSPQDKAPNSWQGMMGVPSAWTGGNAEQAMKQRIMQEGQSFGLTPTEIALITGVGKLESNFGPPGYMGFGPEANAAGFDFSNNPLGAVDQFFRQFMARRGAEGDPNDPQAVANYIWHTVHAAADPQYGRKLLSAAGLSPVQTLAAGGMIGAGFLGGLLNSLGMVTGGKGGIDDVLIRATAGEMVMNKGATAMFGPLLETLNAKGFDTGGMVAAESWAASQNGQPYTYGNLDCSGLVASAWGILTGRGPGHWFDTTAFASDSSAAQFGFLPGSMPGAFNIAVNPEPGQQGHMVGMFPDGTIIEAGGSDAKVKFGSSANFGGFEKHFYLAGMPQAPGWGVSLVDWHGGRGSGGGGGGSPFPGGGPGGAFDPKTGLPGMPGQYGGYGTYGGETYDEMIQRQRDVQDRQLAITGPGGLDERIQDKKDEIDQLSTDITDLRSKETPFNQAETEKQIAAKQKQLDRAKEELAKLEQVDKPRAEQDLERAQRKQGEEADKAPRGLGRGDYRSGGYDAAQEFGRGFLSGILEELGFPDVFGGKSPLDWGITKLLGRGLGTLFQWGNQIGDRMYPDSGGGQFEPGGGMPTLGMPSVVPSTTHFGTGLPPGPTRHQGTGAAPGPRQPVVHVQGDYMPTIVHPAGDANIAGAVQDQRQSWGNAQQIANIPQALPG
jgi:hypothetical protein